MSFLAKLGSAFAKAVEEDFVTFGHKVADAAVETGQKRIEGALQKALVAREVIRQSLKDGDGLDLDTPPQTVNSTGHAVPESKPRPTARKER